MPGPAQITAQQSESHRGEMEGLGGLLSNDLSDLGRFVSQAADDLPAVFQSLLAHDDHMTVTLEAHHESLVGLQVLADASTAEGYARKSILVRQTDDSPVQLGIMRLDLSGLPQVVRQQIESREKPLGRILIRNNLLRQVELLALWRVEPGPELTDALRLAPETQVYARSARILVDGRPAVELLEIVKA
ncbi:MAG: hypothetical protein KDA37_11140 [Planctomycetales bacterium]|nr:hypothetical protein [Planctomycetales bacterium]